ncbi:MAG: MmgE/PrpD family protein [Paracoccaceae bacterium]
MSVTSLLSKFSRQKQLPDSALEMMRLSLLDWSACALAGSNEPVTKIVQNLVLSEGGSPQALCVGATMRAPLRNAALINGVTSHALDYDDTHFAHIGHPSVAVVPTALAVAEHVGSSGADFLKAALIGIEASIRVGIWLGRSHYQAGFHQTATAGTFGATIAAGRLLELDPDQMEHALGIASTRASGLKSQFGTMGKPMNAGIAASNGVEAALLAKSGFLSNPKGLECMQGFADTHAGASDGAGFVDIGKTWLFESISHKFHACCHGVHATLEAIGKIASEIQPEHVKSVKIVTNPRWQNVCNIQQPVSELEAKFSYNLTAAMALSQVSTGDLNSFSQQTLQNAGIAALRGKVEVQFNPDIPETAAKVVVVMDDGKNFKAQHDLNAKISMDQRREKLQAKAAALVGQDHAQNLWRAISTGPDMKAFAKLLAMAKP